MTVLERGLEGNRQNAGEAQSGRAGQAGEQNYATVHHGGIRPPAADSVACEVLITVPSGKEFRRG